MTTIICWQKNAEIVDYFVREVVEFADFALYTHDRGVSIGLSFLGNYLDNPDPGYTVNYHFLSNSGMFSHSLICRPVK